MYKEQKALLERMKKVLEDLHGSMLFGFPEDVNEPEVDMDAMPPLAVYEYISAIHYVELASKRLSIALYHLPDED